MSDLFIGHREAIPRDGSRRAVARIVIVDGGIKARVSDRIAVRPEAASLELAVTVATARQERRDA
jgi:hypothetical protein